MGIHLDGGKWLGAEVFRGETERPLNPQFRRRFASAGGALPQKADIINRMSASLLIPSELPSTADVIRWLDFRPRLTLFGHFAMRGNCEVAPSRANTSTV